MKLVLVNPAKVELRDWPQELLDKVYDDLAYRDKRVEYAIRREKEKLSKHNRGQFVWEVKKFGTQPIEEKIKDLQSKLDTSALFCDKGVYWTFSGYAKQLAKLGQCEIERLYDLPESIGIKHSQLKIPRWYQKEGCDLLIEQNHGAVSICTGGGKSLMIAMLIAKYGQPALVMAPTDNIARQLLEELRAIFGKDKVGQFFDQKKESGKHIVVGICKGMGLLKEGTTHFEAIAQKKLFIADESHMLAADTLQKVCMGLCQDMPYRYFFSATQMRGDGLEPILHGLIGPIVLTYTTKQGIDEGFLCPGEFTQIETRSDALVSTRDPIELNRIHVHKNRHIAEQAVWLANMAATKGHRVLILVEEVEQFLLLHQHLKHEHRFAYGTMTAANKKSFKSANIPEMYFKSDPTKLVKQFDNGEYPILIGTSCIAMGTDFQYLDFIIDLYGGSSEIRLRQAIGRGVRKPPGKKKFYYFDFKVANIGSLLKQSEKRCAIMEDIGIVKHKRIDLGG